MNTHAKHWLQSIRLSKKEQQLLRGGVVVGACGWVCSKTGAGWSTQAECKSKCPLGTCTYKQC